MSESHLDAAEFHYPLDMLPPSHWHGISDEFPTVTQLRNGVILNTIAHAVWLVGANLHEHWWVGDNYSCSDGQSTIGEISFVGAEVVAAFADAHSPRMKRALHVESGAFEWDWTWLTAGMPAALLRAANQPGFALERRSHDELGTTTAVFWSVNGRVAAAEPWPRVYDHGAHILRRALLEPDALWPELADDYGFGDDSVEVIRAIFARKQASGRGGLEEAHLHGRHQRLRDRAAQPLLEGPG